MSLEIASHPLSEVPVALASGDLLFEAGHIGSVWQLSSGALRLDRVDREGARFMQIVLPGDLLGLELLAAYPHAFSARAWRAAACWPLRPSAAWPCSRV